MHHPEYRGTSGNFSCAPAVNKTSLEETAHGDKENGQRPSGRKRVRFFSCFVVLLIPVTNYQHMYFVEKLFKLFWRIPPGNASKLRVIVTDILNSRIYFYYITTYRTSRILKSAKTSGVRTGPSLLPAAFLFIKYTVIDWLREDIIIITLVKKGIYPHRTQIHGISIGSFFNSKPDWSLHVINSKDSVIVHRGNKMVMK